jgi:hypothetical protein
LIFAFRRFFSEPIINFCIPAHRPGSASATHRRLPAIIRNDQPIVLSHHTVRELSVTVKRVRERVRESEITDLAQPYSDLQRGHQPAVDDCRRMLN